MRKQTCEQITINANDRKRLKGFVKETDNVTPDYTVQSFIIGVHIV